MPTTSTRTLIADRLTGAFDNVPAKKEALLAHAGGTGANDGVMLTLNRLPDRTYATLRDLWTALPDVPIE